jgi:hypothetical protein
MQTTSNQLVDQSNKGRGNKLKGGSQVVTWCAKGGRDCAAKGAGSRRREKRGRACATKQATNTAGEETKQASARAGAATAAHKQPMDQLDKHSSNDSTDKIAARKFRSSPGVPKAGVLVPPKGLAADGEKTKQATVNSSTQTTEQQTKQNTAAFTEQIS